MGPELCFVDPTAFSGTEQSLGAPCRGTEHCCQGALCESLQHAPASLEADASCVVDVSGGPEAPADLAPRLGDKRKALEEGLSRAENQTVELD